MPKLAIAVALLVASLPARAQSDPLQAANQALLQATHQRFGFTLEERTRWEQKDGVAFGKAVDQQDMLSRLRVGAHWQPADWLAFTATGQDSRAAFYGVPAPNTIRDTFDLQQAYVELGESTTGLGALAGRRMLDYGDSRLIGSPQWSNVARTYDTARVYYRTARTRWELLLVSPVKVLPDDFNRPQLGERIWGTYDTLPAWRGATAELYALRHSQNRIGGWTGAGTLGTNTFGGRLYGPLADHFSYSLEGAVQSGHLGPATQRAHAWFLSVSRPIPVLRRTLAWSLEYKGASGSRPGAAHVATFDQLSPANHDKFGHQDLFGWRNLITVKSLATWNLTKALAWNAMYTNEWLYSAGDALYNGQGAAIAQSKTGAAGRHVGQEFDTFVTARWGAHLVGAGFGHFFRGGFIDATTARINPRYFYVFQQYTIKAR